MALSDRIVVIDRGRIQQVGQPPELYRDPANEFVAAFIGESNLLRCRVADSEGPAARLVTAGGTEVWVPRGAVAPGGPVTLMIRPDALRLDGGGGPGATVRGRVDEVVYLGDVRRYTVRINTQETLVVRMASRAGSAIRVGAAVAVSWDPMDARIL